MIRLILLFFFFMITISIYGQGNSIKLIDNNDVKVRLHTINDTLGYLHIEEFQYDQYILGKYLYFQDTLYFLEIEDDLLIKYDVFYSLDTTLKRGELKLRSYFTHLLTNGVTTSEKLKYVIGDSIYSLSYNSGSTHDVIIKPFDQVEEISIYFEDYLFGSFEVILNKDINVISFKITELFTHYTNTDQYLDELFDNIAIEIQGNKTSFIFISVSEDSE